MAHSITEHGCKRSCLVDWICRIKWKIAAVFIQTPFKQVELISCTFVDDGDGGGGGSSSSR